jgi:hypothetical protein
VELVSIVLVDSWRGEPLAKASLILAAISTDSSLASLVHVVRPARRLSASAAKKFGLAQARALTRPPQLVVFVSGRIAASAGWLSALSLTLNDHPNAVVYPAVDVLAEDGFVRGDEVVGALDWSLRFVWESWDASRMPLLPTAALQDATSTSPAAPPFVALSVETYERLGGFGDGPGDGQVDLSLRAWLCGGQVLRQPCARLAVAFPHLRTAAWKGRGIVQVDEDRAALTLAAELISNSDWRETVFAARFTGRVPAPVELTQLRRVLPEGCQSFEWFATEVFPGLLADRTAVTCNSVHVTTCNYNIYDTIYIALLCNLLHVM